jgi:hypothetical protein
MPHSIADCNGAANSKDVILHVMIDVCRRSINRSPGETEASELYIVFGVPEILAVFRHQECPDEPLALTQSYAGTRRGSLPGFAPEGTFHILPVLLEEVEKGVARHVGLELSEDGDVYLQLSVDAGRGRPKFAEPRFAVADISDTAEGFLEKGIRALVVPSIRAIERERSSRAQWGLSFYDNHWVPQSRH